jgi:hypothetical protein
VREEAIRFLASAQSSRQSQNDTSQQPAGAGAQDGPSPSQRSIGLGPKLHSLAYNTLQACPPLERVTTPWSSISWHVSSAQEFREIWKSFAMQAAVLVTSAEVHGPTSPYATRLEAFMMESLSRVDKILVLNSKLYFESM